MRVLWIVNIPFGPMMPMVGLKGDNPGGSWLNAALAEFEASGDAQLCVATTWRTKSRLHQRIKNVDYYVLPGGDPSRYNDRSPVNRRHWEALKAEFAPDLIQVWGTEYRHGLHAVTLFREVPSVVYIQGLLCAVGRHYTAGLSLAEQLQCRGVRDFCRLNPVRAVARDYQRRSRGEQHLLALSKNVILENMWSESQCQALAPGCRIFRSKLPIRQEFFDVSWEEGSMEPYTVMCNTSGYPVKGLHMLIKALALVVRHYPQAVLKIPGSGFSAPKSPVALAKVNGYHWFIKRLIKACGVERNVRFLGVVPTSADMAREMARANVFVMPSSIENHSSTLIEAMVVGAPCVAADVGGVLELVQNGVTGLVYRFEEYELLAAQLGLLFRERALAASLGARARERMRAERRPAGIREELVAAYRGVLSRKEDAGHGLAR